MKPRTSTIATDRLLTQMTQSLEVYLPLSIGAHEVLPPNLWRAASVVPAGMLSRYISRDEASTDRSAIALSSFQRLPPLNRIQRVAQSPRSLADRYIAVYYALAWFQTAELLFLEGLGEQAAECFQRVLAVNPKELAKSVRAEYGRTGRSLPDLNLVSRARDRLKLLGHPPPERSTGGTGQETDAED